MLEPSDSCRGKGRPEQKEEKSNPIAQRCELLVRSRVEGPDTIKSRALPQQSSCGKARHDSAEEQEDAYRDKSWRLVLDDKIEASVIAIHASHTLCHNPPNSKAAGVTARKATP